MVDEAAAAAGRVGAGDRLVRLGTAEGARWGLLREPDSVELWTDAPWQGGAPTGEHARVAGHSLLAPVAPTKILCVGRNYAAHAAELGHAVPAEPLLFLKPPSALLGPGEPIVLPPASARVEHEGELGVVLGRRLAHGDRAAAESAIAGLLCANDVTARDLQRRDVQFTRGKGFDTFCPCGPWVALGVDATAPRQVRVRVNGALRQDGTTAQMIWDVPALLVAMSSVMTLEPGDLVLTGTPPGVGPLLDGDEVEVEIEGVGRLRNPVRAAGGAREDPGSDHARIASVST